MLIANLLLVSVLHTTAPLPPRGWQLARNWEELSPEDRDRAQQGRRKYEELPEGDRKGFERNRNIWQRLSPDQKQELRQRFNQKRSISSGD